MVVAAATAGDGEGRLVQGERLARWLVERGKVDLAAVEEARRTQAFFGGDLGSHLVQLGHLTESDLGEALVAVTGVNVDMRPEQLDPAGFRRLTAALSPKDAV